MKIYITKHFEKKYISKIKLFNKIKFVEKLKTYNLIVLKHPYLKFKFNLLGISYRWVVIITKSWNIIPIILCLKKDKNCGENIIFEKFERKILENQNKNLQDIENNNFMIYE